jgi:two-component system cell cycle response regulator DivK
MTSLEDAYIILVEDDPNAQLITLDLLRLGGVDHCYSRKTVDSAIAFAEKLPRVDLFLVDINMPMKSGYEMLSEVRDHEKFTGTKVVALTAATLPEDVQKARDSGFDGFLSKPLKPGEFSGQIESILAGGSVWDSR